MYRDDRDSGNRSGCLHTSCGYCHTGKESECVQVRCPFIPFNPLTIKFPVFTAAQNRNIFMSRTDQMHSRLISTLFIRSAYPVTRHTRNAVSNNHNRHRNYKRNTGLCHGAENKRTGNHPRRRCWCGKGNKSRTFPENRGSSY